MHSPTVSGLLARWEEAYLQGHDLPAEHLCPERPDLVLELRRAIDVLRSMNRMLGREPAGNGHGENLSADSVPAGATPSLGPTIPLPASGWPQVAGYEIEEVLGRGGMGVVYKARQLKANRTVALKMLLAGAHAGAEELARFRTEAEAAARLQHPGIVQVFEVGEHAGLPFFSLEFCPGGSLQCKLGSSPLPARQAAELAEELARAVQAAHDAGVLHRDLKPANVLLSAGGAAKVSDFGLARKLDDAGQTASGAVLGTPSYMAPEQARGRTREIGPAIDVYALGAILYELLTGRPPFRAATVMDTLLQVIHNEPVPPAQLAPSTPRDLETICLKCLQKDPHQRYPSAASLGDDLRRFLKGEPILARPVGRLERGLKWVRRSPVVAALLAAVVLVTALGFALVLYQRNNAVAALQREEKARAERALAQVDALTDAAPQAVPGILERLAEDRADVLPRLRELWQQPDTPANHARRMRVALALLPVQPEAVRDELAKWMLAVEEPAEMLLVRDALRPHACRLRRGLWDRLARQQGDSRLRLLAALAAFDPDSPRWRAEGERALPVLLSANTLHLGSWAQALRPVRGELLAPLGEVFRGRRLPERREAATTLLADYARDDPAVLVDLLRDADPRQFAVLWPLVQKQRAKTVPLLERALANSAQPGWGDRPLDPGWRSPAAGLVREIEQAHGLVAERFALCQTLPWGRFHVVAEGLRAAGYRPSSVRPYTTRKDLRVTALWRRDGRPWRVEHGPLAALREREEQLRGKGFRQLERIGIVVDRVPCFVSVWVGGAEKDPPRPAREYVLLGGLSPAAQCARWRALQARGYRPAFLGAIGRAPGPAAAKGENLLTSSAWERPIVSAGVGNRAASRQANSAAALARLGRAERLWPLLRHDTDPQLRSYLIDRLGPLGIDARTLLSRLEREQDVSVRCALVLCLGQLPATPRRAWEKRLLRWYRKDPDAGLHGALDWLLRQRWGQAAALDRVDRELAAGKRSSPAPGAARGPTWFVNGQGQTYMRIAGPVEFLMGSPGHEADRNSDEPAHHRRIGRSFALASKPVTVRQFRAFLKANPKVGHFFEKKHSPDPDGPIVSVTWYKAAQYCRWLSEKEKVPEDQMCYPPVEDIKPGMKLPADYLRRTGYRLPTEAEWEYACRAGAVTSRSYGSDARLLDRYAWYWGNSDDRAWPVGRKLPNDFGLFDMLGNVWTWCQDRYRSYPAPTNGRAEDKEDLKAVSSADARVFRGGSYYNRAAALRCAMRNNDVPSSGYATFGIRPARTCR
jgi:formylglycine-generating enzyme required for sulfatase activity/tRNA A-37 threonylcarbamoyl transferase component Bud32